MSYVEILILRHLRRRPAHGYELRKRVERTTGFVLNNNSLYPALRRFEEAGAVTRTAQPQEGRPPRNVYTITDVGLELLRDMLAELPPEQAGDDTEFLARLGQFSLLEPRERVAVLDARDRALRGRLEHLTQMHGLARGDPWAVIVTGELIRRDERELAWLRELRALAAEGAGTTAEGTETAQADGTAEADSTAQADGTAEGAQGRGAEGTQRPGAEAALRPGAEGTRS